MIGAIVGDIVGSRFEFHNIKFKDFELFGNGCRFTDDTVMTIAVADAIMNNKDIVQTLTHWGKKYPKVGYGPSFRSWIWSEPINQLPYNSWGNGAAMRVSSIPWLYKDLETILQKTKEVTIVSHNHPEGIKGAEATVTAIWMALNGFEKDQIKFEIFKNFNYILDRKLDDIRKTYTFDVSCQGSVPEAIIAFLESTDYEDAIRNAVSIGGDSDTIACITGGIAEAYYRNTKNKISDELIFKSMELMDHEMYGIVDLFLRKSKYFDNDEKINC